MWVQRPIGRGGYRVQSVKKFGKNHHEIIHFEERNLRLRGNHSGKFFAVS